ncbi:pentatricopeptide repeat-containing protein [Panicum miliaceum]|uniref:Pentatricopeptide repeat-containing protein n=1 Tax=Panicum miliaceum TaxID=4540 RepID=A0A3L6RSZ0_PANMI|nr:pentatricopeptide repeat-containing protein [Panicum miliaceum]
MSYELSDVNRNGFSPTPLTTRIFANPLQDSNPPLAPILVACPALGIDRPSAILTAAPLSGALVGPHRASRQQPPCWPPRSHSSCTLCPHRNSSRRDEAIDCFRAMLLDGIEPDYVTLIAVLSACAEVGALGLGMWVHRLVVRQGLESNVRVANSLIDMYARCGQAELAAQVFRSLRKQTVVSWNSMIVGFAANGRCTDAIELFEEMRRQGFKPDAVTLTGVLTACSHAGLTEQGLRYYDLMTTQYGVTARMEHYGCVVDLLGRAGRLDEAMRVVETMPMRPNEVVLGALLAGCRMHGDLEMAEQLMQHLLELDPGGDANYVLLSNVYAAVGKWDGAGKVRSLMKARGLKKRPGYRALEVDGDVHEFVSGDRSHPQAEEIGQILGLLGHEMYDYDDNGGSCFDGD